MNQPKDRFGALAQQERFSVSEAVGGPRGLAEAGIPGVFFVIVYTVVGRLQPALWAAIGVAGLLAAVRLARRESVRQAVSGLVVVAVCAFVAARSGQAEDFYLPGLWINAGYATVYSLTIAVRWPIIGVFVGPLLGEGLAWRRDPARLRAYQWTTLLWVIMFLLRITVQWPLYAAGLVAPLGAARLAMGLPLFALTAYLSWLILRRVPRAAHHPADERHSPAG